MYFIKQPVQYLLLCIFLFYHSAAICQSTSRNKFFEADYAIQLNDYETALKLFNQLLKKDPENALYNYRVGQCLINLPDLKKMALPYLEIAVKNVTEEFKEGNFSETNAPTETYFLLAKAYHINENLDNAIYYYNRYLPYINDKSEISYVNSQIKACELAKNYINNPVTIQPERLGAPINTELSEIYPVISEDESVLIYLEKHENNNIVYFSRKEGEKWTKPTDINNYIGSVGNSYPSSISSDNKRLYFTVKDYFTSGICYSTFDNNKWTKMKKLNNPINTKSWNSHAFESISGNEIYFVSDRKGGYGGLDIYKSIKKPNGKWDTPENLGNIINTNLNEIMPIISPDEKELFFCSEGHSSMGGYDIFVSDKTASNIWSEPLNLGYPLNTTDDNVYFRPLKEGIIAYNSLPQPDDISNYDIYRIEINPKLERQQEEITLTINTNEILDNDQPEIKLQIENHDIIADENDVTYKQTSNLVKSEKEITDYQKPGESENLKSISEYKQLYTIQLMALKNPVRVDFFKDIIEINVQIGDDGFYRYIMGQFDDINKAKSDLKKATSLGYENAFIRKLDLYQYLSENNLVSSHSPYEHNIRPIKDYYTIQIIALRNPVSNNYFNNLSGLKVSYGSDKIFRYTYKEFSTYDSAKTNLEIIQKKGYKEAFIKKISDISNY